MDLFKLIFKKDKKITTQQSDKTQTGSSSEGDSFKNYVTKMEHNKIQQEALATYNYFANQYGNIGFGESGANEFVGATLLNQYRPILKNEINYGIEQVFKRHFSPLQFSDYMDEIVNRSDVPYPVWSAVYNYLNDNVQWIKNHAVSGKQSVTSPYVTEALWGVLDNEVDISYSEYPTDDESRLVDDEVEIVIQVNGKICAKVAIAKGTPKEDIKAIALANEKIQEYITDKTILTVVVIPNKLVNIVVK